MGWDRAFQVMNNVARLPLTTKVEVAQGVLEQLYAAEAAIDAAMVEAARLTQTMIEARQELGLAATVGAGALSKVTASMSEMGQARAEMVEAHNELNELRLRMGMRTSMIGVADKPTDGNDGRP